MGLGHVELAMVQAEAAKARHRARSCSTARRPTRATCTRCCTGRTDEQKEKYLRPLCDGHGASCFAMTEPEVAGSDPTLIQTRAVPGRRRVGHQRPQVVHLRRARGAEFAILIARTEDDPDIPQAANTAFIVDLPADGLERRARGRDDARLGTATARSSSRTCACHDDQMLGGRGKGHLLGQYRLGPARLAHCMRWIAQAETALDMMVDRSLNRYAHGSLLAEKQGIQWMIADSAMELYQCKLMVLHAAYKIDHRRRLHDRGVDGQALRRQQRCNRIIDRAIQVHGALGYSTDTPLADMFQHARWARFADGADEIHQMRIAERTIAAYQDTGTTKAATGDLPL